MKKAELIALLEEKETLCNSEDTVKILRKKITNWDQEHFFSIFLNGGGDIVKLELTFKGTTNQSLIHPINILRNFLYTKKAVAIIVAHNHPSGKLNASHEDLEVTKELNKSCKIMGIPLLDHLIFTEIGYYSFHKNKLI